MKRVDHPSLMLSTLAAAALTALWVYVRIWVFQETAVPLTFVLPLLICVWTRRPWQLWSMAGIFVGFAVLNIYVMLPTEAFGGNAGRLSHFVVTVFNITVGSAVVRAIIGMRSKLDERSARLAAQNAELRRQAEELARQNEEIRAQDEELAQQNEEIESQTEELAVQNEDLHEANTRLNQREAALQMLLESVRTPETGDAALANICERALGILGTPADVVAVLRLDGDQLEVVAQSAADHVLKIPARWPVTESIAKVVLERNQTAYVFDLQRQTELAAPFRGSSEVRSAFATPIRGMGTHHGIVVACSRQAAHWSPDQFRTIEWVAAQCGLISEALRWRHELTARARDIEAANHAKDQFLAMLSHELRTPLTPVLAAAGVLEHDSRIPEDVRQDIGMIRRNVAIQSRLVDDLLDLTKLERGKLALQIQPLDCAALLHESALIVSPDIDAKGQSLVLDLLAAEGQRVEGDGPRLQQVFWNLLKNAVRFSPPQARICLRTRLVAGLTTQIAVEVADSGIGLEPEHIARIFRPFEQVSAVGRNRSGDSGLGLGLSIAKAIVELHGGSIAVTSEGLGRGSCFTVQLPLMPPAPANSDGNAPTAMQVEESAEARALRILLVEDHADTGRVLARLLRRSGHSVDHCENARAAVALFGQNHYDVLVSDLGLPDESGLELMKKLRAVRPELPGICLTGYGMEEDLHACRQVGFSEHLTKPVDMKRLHAAIGRVSVQKCDC